MYLTKSTKKKRKIPMIIDLPDDVIDAVVEMLRTEDPYWRWKLGKDGKEC